MGACIKFYDTGLLDHADRALGGQQRPVSKLEVTHPAYTAGVHSGLIQLIKKAHDQSPYYRCNIVTEPAYRWVKGVSIFRNDHHLVVIILF